jgi:sulfite reductase (NADPH) flavoprotein alpha-component
MAAHSKQVWEWIKQGAILYVCGDAEHMAKDVQKTLIDIIHHEGGYSVENASQFLQKLRKDKRYQTDVY